jgi:peptide/nickel transport system substrate-binding protein
VRGDRVELARNPDYWGTPVALSAATFRFIPDPAAATAAMLAGDLDAYPNFPAPEALDQFRDPARFTVRIGTTEGKTIMALNEARAPFGDVRVRRALAYAIDRKAFIQGVESGYGAVIGSHYVPTDPGYVDLTGKYPYDPAQARALLREAGATNLRFRLMLPPPPYARLGGEVVAAMLQQVGVHVDLVPIEWAQWIDQVFLRSDYDATLISHVEPRDLDIYARPKYYFNYHDKYYNDLYTRYVAATDPARQMALLGDLQRKLADDEANVFIFALPQIGVWNAKLTGYWDNQPIPANDLTELRWTK